MPPPAPDTSQPLYSLSVGGQFITGFTPSRCGDGVVNDAGAEECDDGGESTSCDADCTARTCGDGTVNVTAGEECDDSGESATCDADCTARTCGDGTVNVTAGEECDDAGESATCDADCTARTCGDGTVNVTAGEECDDSGESATCDADCTLPVHGDGVVNTLAGEECDDGNTNNGDACSAEGIEAKLEKLTDLIFSLVKPMAARSQTLQDLSRGTMQAALIIFFLGILDAARLARSSSIGLKESHITDFMKMLIENVFGVKL